MRVQDRGGLDGLNAAEMQRALKSLRTEFGSIASAIISRDGILIASDIPEGVIAETFTIMCATMMGAASTAHSELRIGQPKMMRVTSEKHEMMLVSAGRKMIIVCVVPIGVNIDQLQARLREIIESTQQEAV